MSGRNYRLTDLADADIDEILTYTHRTFGPRQFERYLGIIDKAGRMVGEYPMYPGSSARDEFGQGVRSFHIEIAAGSKGAASHLLYYVPGALEDGTQGTVILRVLSDEMEPRPYVARGVGEFKRRGGVSNRALPARPEFRP